MIKSVPVLPLVLSSMECSPELPGSIKGTLTVSAATSLGRTLVHLVLVSFSETTSVKEINLLNKGFILKL